MTQIEDFDVLVVGAGLSGIGAGYYLQRDCPGKSYVILENRDAIGGTWDLFRYPGIRSDSDMFTLGYAFKPWTEQKAIADGPSIRKYVNDTADEYGIRPHIRFKHRVVRADWSSDEARWTVEAEHNGQTKRFRAKFVLMAAGYYNYEQGYLPEFKGADRFKGKIVHPQHWPEDLDYSGKRVVVIGSGATAVTLVPAMTDKAAHVTMLQRSPTYMVSLPAEDTLANWMRARLPASWAYNITRLIPPHNLLLFLIRNFHFLHQTHFHLHRNSLIRDFTIDCRADLLPRRSKNNGFVFVFDCYWIRLGLGLFVGVVDLGLLLGGWVLGDLWLGL